MLRRIGVTTLIYWCPLYLDYSAQLPIATTGVADQFGSAVHELIYRMLSGDHKGLFDTEEDLAWSVLLESFPGAVESSFTEQVVKEMLNMARAAKRFAENYNPSQFEVKFEYGFGSDDMLVIGIADALGEKFGIGLENRQFHGRKPPPAGKDIRYHALALRTSSASSHPGSGLLGQSWCGRLTG